MRPTQQLLTADEKDLNPSIEATLPVILRLMHAASIDMNGRFDAAAAELDEHDEDMDEEEEDDGDVDDVGAGRGARVESASSERRSRPLWKGRQRPSRLTWRRRLRNCSNGSVRMQGRCAPCSRSCSRCASLLPRQP